MELHSAGQVILSRTNFDWKILQDKLLSFHSFQDTVHSFKNKWHGVKHCGKIRMDPIIFFFDKSRIFLAGGGKKLVFKE